MKYIDVSNKSELPPAEPGYRYVEFIGGEKELRCYLIPENMPRSQFMLKNEHLLDQSIKLIYGNKGIFIRHDASYSLPGFYIMSLEKHYPAIDNIDAATYLRFSFILRELRLGMRKALGIEYIHLHYDEKPVKSANVHFWLMEVSETTPVLARLNIKEYLSTFRFHEQRNKICDYNNKLIAYIDEIDLSKRDNELITHLEYLNNENMDIASCMGAIT